MSEWQDITGTEGWSRKLEELMGEAKVLAQEGDLAARLTMSDRLTQFIQWSYPNTPEIQELDKLAEALASDIIQKEIEDRLSSLSARSAAYRRLEKTFRAEASSNEARADELRLKGITGAIDATTKAVTALNQLKDSLGSEVSDVQLADDINALAGSVDALRSRIAALV